MDPNRRFSLLTFPQAFDGATLGVNILLLPRNQNPLQAAITGEPGITDAPAFAEGRVTFVAKIISSLAGFPNDVLSRPPEPLVTAVPANAKALFESLAQQFSITNLGVANSNLNVNAPAGRAPAPRTLEQSVMKYLPRTYRSAFNFVSPRTPNARVDTAYHCAVRGADRQPGFARSPEAISWGKVFAHALRQPLLAESLGMIYRTQLAIDAAAFPQGGWLFVDLADDSDFKTQQGEAPGFLARYAARIPALTPGTPRSVFAAVHFPVSPAKPPGSYDAIFQEVADYDDGFGKIVHATQPVSKNLLLEESDGAHPTHDAGIRLGWDDEQILVWYIRQLAEDPSVAAGQRIDAPLGTAGYRIDVREKQDPPAPWTSLNLVSSRAPLAVVNPADATRIELGNFDARELNHCVYPVQLDGDGSKHYWLPMYFAHWAGKSMVLPDDDAAEIYRHADAKPDAGTHVSGPPASALNTLYQPAAAPPTLTYGTEYQFRVRLGDLTGGGPLPDAEPFLANPSQVATWRFKRYVAPHAARISDLPFNAEDPLFAGNEIKVRRPILAYPAVVFTGKYADPIPLLKQAALDTEGEAFGLADPDVEAVELTVELETLKMDNLASASGREHYIVFYRTTRRFPRVSPEFADELVVPLEFRDCRVLRFGDPGDLGDLGVTTAELAGMDALILPTARRVRITLRPVGADQPNYYGLEEADPERNTRFGRTTQFHLYRPSLAEVDLFAATSPARRLQAIYLQPDPPAVFDGSPLTLLLGREVEKAPDMVQRLAQQLGVESRGLTLSGRKGERVQFGCSNRIRHTLSPDNAALTFASKGDLVHHWLCCITLEIERDWPWDGLEDRSLVITRRKRFREDDEATETDFSEVGDIELKRTASFNALHGPERRRTTVIFIDAVETKNERKDADGNVRPPDLIEVGYVVTPQFRPGHGGDDDDGEVELSIELPITDAPAQVPKIVSAGLALSPYKPNARYSATEPRRRHLWIEFEEPIKDAKDEYFARVLAYAPDQLISNNHPDLFAAPDEPALPIAAEPIRVVTFGQSDDEAGLDAMQRMERSTDSPRHYLLPLPPDLHADAPEMFGFFKYEFRVGHHRYREASSHHAAGASAWCTAQGRFGRPLGTTGVQHPAPTLTCTVNRDADKLYVTAPYAVAVANGKNVTSDPPRTEIWCLLYAQVKQADNRAFRNIVLDDRLLDSTVRVQQQLDDGRFDALREGHLFDLQKAVLKNWKGTSLLGETIKALLPVQAFPVAKDATKFGTAIWHQPEIVELLARHGLPETSPLSVLCVEVLPQITNSGDHLNWVNEPAAQGSAAKSTVAGANLETAAREVAAGLRQQAFSVNLARPKPLSDDLGKHRILRTSPLTEVPFACTG